MSATHSTAVTYRHAVLLAGCYKTAVFDRAPEQVWTVGGPPVPHYSDWTIMSNDVGSMATTTGWRSTDDSSGTTTSRSSNRSGRSRPTTCSSCSSGPSHPRSPAPCATP